jgi:hypothetical protein
LNKLVSLWLGSSEKIIWKHEGVKNRAVSKKYLLYFKIQSQLIFLRHEGHIHRMKDIVMLL